MFPLTGNNALLLAPLFGIAFGWLLHRGRVTDYNVIVNQLRLRDFTVLKVMLTAIVVGGIGVLFLTENGLARFALREANLGGVIIGGLLFGIGMVVYGYCPGTGFAAMGTGNLHAAIGALGMMFGAAVYAYSFDWLRATVLSWSNLGRISLADVTGLPLWSLYAVLAVLSVMLFVWLERRPAVQA